jgi:hypothetical protein
MVIIICVLCGIRELLSQDEGTCSGTATQMEIVCGFLCPSKGTQEQYANKIEFLTHIYEFSFYSTG